METLDHSKEDDGNNFEISDKGDKSNGKQVGERPKAADLNSILDVPIADLKTYGKEKLTEYARNISEFHN